MIPRLFLPVAGPLFLLLAQPGLAAEAVNVIEAPAEAADDGGWSDRVDFAWGAAITSNYISSGQTQSDDRPALQAYGEISSGIVYAGVWFSTVRLDPDVAEFDLYWGLRHDFGPLSLDLNYTRYVYDATGDCCGEWIAKASLEVIEPLTISGEFDYDPQTRDRSATFGAALALNDTLELSGKVERKLVGGEKSWNAGVTWQMTDTLSLDARYHGSDLYPERFVVTLAYDFSTAQ